MSSRMQFMVGLGLCGLTGMKLLPHTLFKNRFQDFMQTHHSDGSKKELDSDVKDLFSQVCEDLKITATEKFETSCFPVIGMDLTHMGSLTMRTGAILGFPRQFTYKKLSDVEREIVAVGGEFKVPWDAEEGRLFEESLILSEKAKKFAIARELCYLKSHYVMVDTFLATSSVFLAYTCGFTTHTVLTKRSGPIPKGLKFTVYSFFAGIVGLMYLVSKDAYNNTLDISCDKDAASLSQEYAEGGIEFYEKQLQRNSALRDLLPYGKGKNWYTRFGNQNQLLRTKSFPLTGRRDKLKTILEDFKAAKKE